MTDANGDQSDAAATVTVNAVTPPPPVKPTAACLAARAKRDKLARTVKTPQAPGGTCQDPPAHAGATAIG